MLSLISLCASILGQSIRKPRPTIRHKAAKRRPLRIERLGNRDMLSGLPLFPVPLTGAALSTTSVASGVVHPDQNNIVLSRMQLTSHEYVADRLNTLQMISATNPQDLVNLQVFALLGSSKIDLHPQEYLDRNNVELLFGGWQAPFFSSYSPLTLEIDATIASNAKNGDQITLGSPFATVLENNWFGEEFIPVHYAGEKNPVYTVAAASPQADLSVSLAGPASVQQSSTLMYSLAAHNSGPGTATGIVSQMPVPLGATLDTAHSSPGVTVNGQSVVWHPANLPNGQSAFATVAFDTSGISVPVGIGTAVVEKATISSSTPDNNPVNNSSNTVETTVMSARADLALTISASAVTVQQNDNVTYTVHVINAGPGAAQGVIVSLPVSSGLLFARSLETRGSYVNGNWIIGALANGQTATLAVVCSVAATSGKITETARVSSQNADVNSLNKSGSVTIEVAPKSVLTVAELNIGANDTAVKNQKNITVSRFQAQSNGVDQMLTSATFTAQQGNLLDGQNYTLWVDTDNDGKVDTILQRGITALNGTVTASTIIGGGYVVPKNSTVTFELHMDVASSLVTDMLQVGLASVQAAPLQNGQLGAASQINLTHGTPKVWHLITEGSLFVSPDVQLRSRQLLAGAVGDEILRLQLRAQNEDVTVTTFRLLAVGAGAQSIDALLLYKMGETTPFATMTVGATGSDVVPTTYNEQPALVLTARMLNQQLVVKDGQDQIISVVPRMKSDEQGAVSGQTFSLVLYDDNVINNTTGEGAIHAVGMESGSNLIGNNGGDASSGAVFIGTNLPGPNADIVSATETVVLSKITSITNANPDPDNTNVPTGIAPIGQFTMTTATNTNTKEGLNKAVPDTTVFTVYATNVALDASSFKFYNKNDASTKVNVSGVVETAPGVYQVTFSGLSTSMVDTRIPSGASETFVLEANITNSKTTTSVSSLYVSLDVGSIKWYDADVTKTLITGVEYPFTTVKSTVYRS